MPGSGATATRSATSTGRCRSIRTTRRPTPTARLAYRQTNRNDQAFADFSRAIQADPNYGPAYIGRGNLLRAQGRYQEALGDLTVAIRLTPESAEALHARGLLYQRQNDHSQAILDFDAAIDRNPFVAAPYAARGQSLVATNQFDKAIEDFNAALNVNNKDAESWAWRGIAYERQGRRQEAVESFQRAVGVDPQNATGKQGLARVQGGGGSSGAEQHFPVIMAALVPAIPVFGAAAHGQGVDPRAKPRMTSLKALHQDRNVRLEAEGQVHAAPRLVGGKGGDREPAAAGAPGQPLGLFEEHSSDAPAAPFLP